jgi:hypothetical protein
VESAGFSFVNMDNITTHQEESVWYCADWF